jgi:hypothetical protein
VKSRRPAIVAAVLTIAMAQALAGCTAVKPWQRGKLAHPTMRPGSLVGVAEGHMHEVQEGASGGADSEGGGCGCN